MATPLHAKRHRLPTRKTVRQNLLQNLFEIQSHGQMRRLRTLRGTMPRREYRDGGRRAAVERKMRALSALRILLSGKRHPIQIRKPSLPTTLHRRRNLPSGPAPKLRAPRTHHHQPHKQKLITPAPPATVSAATNSQAVLEPITDYGPHSLHRHRYRNRTSSPLILPHLDIGHWTFVIGYSLPHRHRHRHRYRNRTRTSSPLILPHLDIGHWLFVIGYSPLPFFLPATRRREIFRRKTSRPSCEASRRPSSSFVSKTERRRSCGLIDPAEIRANREDLFFLTTN